MNAYLTQISASTSFRLKGKSIEGFISDVDTTESEKNSSLIQAKHILSKNDLWNAGFTLRYNLRQKIENAVIDWDKQFFMNTNIKINISKKWKLNYNIYFDIIDRQMVSHSFYFSRPLHCWEFSFQWWPGGAGKGFFLNIHVTNPDLRDIKLESRGGRKELFNF